MEENYLLLVNLAKRVSYKSNYSFLVHRLDDKTALVSLRCPTLPDAQGEDEVARLTINNTVKLSTIVTPSDALQAFARIVADFELHEAAEFFKFDGQQIFLPHGWGDEFGGFTWTDFGNLSGKFLNALQQYLGKI